jgi:hypothetical protein
MTPMQQMLLGQGASKKTYIEDVFSTYVYKGNSGSQTITNEIDNSKGGLLWTKARTVGESNTLFDTQRASNKAIYSNGTEGAETRNFNLSFLSDGFSWNTTDGMVNNSSHTYAAWNFRKSEGFFDLIEFSGNGVAGRTISHSLGSAPGMMLLKRTDRDGDDWYVYHKSIGATKHLHLNDTAAENTQTGIWNDTAPTSAVFSVGSDASVNASGGTYICYLFADDSQVFGEEGNKSIIKCGTYTSNTYQQDINLGFEPQLVMVKKASATGNWYVFDEMRGVAYSNGQSSVGKDKSLYWDEAGTEDSNGDGNKLDFTPSGFQLTGNLGSGNSPINGGGDFIYVAIRRADGYVGKPIEDPTKCFAMDAGNASATIPAFDSNFKVDAGMSKYFTTQYNNWKLGTRDVFTRFVEPDTNDDEDTNAFNIVFDSNKGYGMGSNMTNEIQGFMWKRHKGFDTQCYTGATGNRERTHVMNAVPEMIWVKRRVGDEQWCIGHKDLTGGFTSHHLRFDDSAEYSANQFNTAPTLTQWGTASGGLTNNNDNFYQAFLFSSVAGVSKVSSYTGSSSDQTISLGFAPKFLLIKRIDAAGDWIQMDTTRGIVAPTSGYGDRLITKTGSGTFIVPAGVTSLQVVCVGGGGGANTYPGGSRVGGSGGGGGGLAYINNLTVTPGESISYSVGAGGKGGAGHSSGVANDYIVLGNAAENGEDTWFKTTGTVKGNGGGKADTYQGGSGGGRTGYGGNGGSGGSNSDTHSYWGAGGGAGGYSGNGGNGGVWQAGSWSGGGSGSGGAAGGGQNWSQKNGVGLYGEGSSGAVNQAGSGGFTGTKFEGPMQPFGAGASTPGTGQSNNMKGANGAIRIIWGSSRSFPSTNTGAIGSDEAMMLNRDWTPIDQNYIQATSSTGFTITGNDLLNINSGKYIYYAHA